MPRQTLPETPERELDLIDELLVEWRAVERSKANARSTLAAFARWLAARGSSLAAATTKDCVAWLEARAGEVGPATVVKNWSQLRAFYAIAEDDFADPLGGRRSPMARIRMPRAPKYARTHAATVDEVDALQRSFDLRTGLGLRNAAMVSLMFRSGLRVGEVAALDLHAVDLEARSVHLGLTKTLEPRTPALHPETLALLRRYLRRRGDRPGPLFVNTGNRRGGDRLPVNAIQNVVKRAAARAGVPITPHCLRRGFVVEYLAHGGDIASLMIIGGWESETMVVRYMGDARAATAQTVYDQVAARQVQARRRLRAVG